MKTLKQLAKESEDVQNACNISGILQGAADAAVELRRLLGAHSNTGLINRHPVMRAWAHKIADLSGLEVAGYPSEELRLIQLAPDAAGDMCTVPDCAHCKARGAAREWIPAGEPGDGPADWTLGT